MIKRFDRVLSKISRYGLIFSVSMMLVLTCLNILLRWFNYNLPWIDPVVRHLVFMSAFLGAISATGDNNHIKIDILSTLYKEKFPRLFLYLEYSLSIICMLTCFLMAISGYQFFEVEREFGKTVFLGLHSSVLVLIIPFGFILLGLRFFTNIFNGEKVA